VLYLEPELGVRVGARDPLARRVLARLTRSPGSVLIPRPACAPDTPAEVRSRLETADVVEPE
jgi:hypothetical protein